MNDAGETFWKPGHEGSVFDPDHWLRQRTDDEFDIEDIGALAVPPPKLPDLAANVSNGYQFLVDLTDEERRVARCEPADRDLVLAMLQELPDDQFEGASLY